MKVFSCSLRRASALCLILAITIIPIPSARAQGTSTVGADGLPPLPESTVEKARREGTALPLSLTEVIKMALENNLDIAIENTREENQRISLDSAYATYDPSLSVNLSANDRRSVSNNLTQISRNGGVSNSSGQSWNFSFSKQFMKTGGNFSSSLNSSRSTSSQIDSIDSYSATFSITYRQPLWRNLKIDSARNQIRVANLNIEQNEVSFRSSVSRIIQNVQTQYWQLVSAIENYEIQRNALRIAQTNLRDTQRRLDVGTVPPINVTNARVQVVTNEASVYSAEDRVLQAENSLRQIVSNDRTSDIWKKVIIPTDRPDFVEYRIDPDIAIETALRNRTEIVNARLNLTSLQYSTEISRNSKKWDITPSFTFGKSGSGLARNPCQAAFGSDDCRKNDDGTDMLTYDPKYIGGPFTAYKTAFATSAYNWSVSLNVSIPIWNRQVNNQIAQNDISKRQQLMQLRQQEQTVQVSVMNALQSLESARLQVGIAQLRLEASQEQYEGEMKRFEAGLLENWRLLDVANNLAQSENSYLSALISYKQAVISMQVAMNTLLEESQFTTARATTIDVPVLR